MAVNTPSAAPEASSEVADAVRTEQAPAPADSALRAIEQKQQQAKVDSATKTETLSQEVLGQTTPAEPVAPAVPSAPKAEEPEFLDSVLKYYDAAKARGSSALGATFDAVLFAITTGGSKLWETVSGWASGWFGGDASSAEPNNPDASVTPESLPSRIGRSFNENMQELMKQFGLTETTDEKKNFFTVATELGKEVQAKYGIPYQVVVAQACLESSFGQSRLTQKALNCFGYKKGKSDVPFVTMQTPEYRNGVLGKENADFRSYPSLRDSFMAYGKLISSADRYREAFKYKDDPKRFLEEIIKGGYAGDRKDHPELIAKYVSSAEATVSTYGLTLS